MLIRDLLLSELEGETPRTKASLARVPTDKAAFVPHAKSMPLGRLAAHIAQLGGFGLTILTAPELNFATAGMKPLQFESAEQVVAAFEAGMVTLKEQLRQVPDEAWTQLWKLRADDRVFFEGSRFGAYRAMYLNHMVHHRAQLGVYLRLLDVAVPSIYGPSADEQ